MRDPSGVGLWKTISMVWDTLSPNLCIVIGDGKRVKVWKDRQEPLKNCSQFCMLYPRLKRCGWQIFGSKVKERDLELQFCLESQCLGDGFSVEVPSAITSHSMNREQKDKVVWKDKAFKDEVFSIQQVKNSFVYLLWSETKLSIVCRPSTIVGFTNWVGCK